jgi:hypothetical protein
LSQRGDNGGREKLRLYADNLRLRELVALVAQDLERLARQRGEAEWQGPLLARAMRITQHLHR